MDGVHGNRSLCNSSTVQNGFFSSSPFSRVSKVREEKISVEFNLYLLYGWQSNLVTSNLLRFTKQALNLAQGRGEGDWTYVHFLASRSLICRLKTPSV